MITGRSRFNIYFLVGLAAWACVAGGCATTADDPEKEEKEKQKLKDKQVATVRVHLEVLPDAMDFSTSVPIFREKPVMVNVDKDPFVTEANVSDAKIVDVEGGFMLQIEFDRRGLWLIENVTTTNPGRHYAIFSEFGPKMKENRWLAAPLISRRISNGIITFTPDASREEAQQIVDGLKAVAKKVKEKSKW